MMTIIVALFVWVLMVLAVWLYLFVYDLFSERTKE